MTTIVVGLSGPSCSGKSSAANILANVLHGRCRLLRQDSYYLPQDELPIHTEFGQDWDSPESFDNEKFAKDLHSLKLESQFESQEIPFDPSLNRKEQDKVLSDTLEKARHHLVFKHKDNPVTFVIVEGILLYHEQNVEDQFHLKVVLTAEESVLKERRYARKGYATNDGDVWTDPPGYWERLVWPNHVQYFKTPADALIYRTDPGPNSSVEDIVYQLCVEIDHRFLSSQ
jgi:nicotinamide/nicotinate riboside kinase